MIGDSASEDGEEVQRTLRNSFVCESEKEHHQFFLPCGYPFL